MVFFQYKRSISETTHFSVLIIFRIKYMFSTRKGKPLKLLQNTDFLTPKCVPCCALKYGWFVACIFELWCGGYLSLSPAREELKISQRCRGTESCWAAPHIASKNCICRNPLKKYLKTNSFWALTYLQIKRIYMFHAVQMNQQSPQILNFLSINYLQKLHVQIPTLGLLRK